MGRARRYQQSNLVAVWPPDSEWFREAFGRECATEHRKLFASIRRFPAFEALGQAELDTDDASVTSENGGHFFESGVLLAVFVFALAH
jgi:hypothetical protein